MEAGAVEGVRIYDPDSAGRSRLETCPRALVCSKLSVPIRTGGHYTEDMNCAYGGGGYSGCWGASPPHFRLPDPRRPAQAGNLPAGIPTPLNWYVVSVEAVHYDSFYLPAIMTLPFTCHNDTAIYLS